MNCVYLLDVNVLIALTNPSHIHHTRAHAWFRRVSSWATTPVTETAFIRLMTNSAVAGRPVSREEAVDVLGALRAWPGHRFLPDDSSLADPVIDLVGLVGHRQVTDFHLVNLAAAHHMVLATFDRAIPEMLVVEDQRWVELV